jgi:MoaA/NifB/PqqE/SkfB family radical SAM enzyme
LDSKWKGLIPKPLCIAPWKALSIDSFGNVAPDGIFRDPYFGNLNTSSLSEMWDGEVWSNLRKDHINFSDNIGCSNCVKKEQFAGHSRRKFFETFFTTRIPQDTLEEKYYYPDTRGDPNLNNPIRRPKVENFDKPDFIYLDINTSNKCNLKCIHCNGDVSTAWIPDEKKLKKKHSEVFRNEQNPYGYYSIDDAVIENLFSNKDYFKNLQFVAFRGGEPFYEDKNIKILEKLIEFGWNDRITLDISTNATIINPEFFELLTKFKKIVLYLSIEGIGELYQLCRGGLHYDQAHLDKMIQYFISFDNIELCIAYTTMAPNIFNIAQTWEWFQQYKDKATITFTNTVVTPKYLSHEVLTREMKQTAYDMIKYIDDEMPYPYDGSTYTYSAGIYKFRKNLLKTIKEDDSDNQPYLFNMFRNYMNALDTIRKTNFLEIVPTYRKYWNE